ncbi:MAG: hypothetical protein EBZ59_05710 [Planctomycetia bacterium]|nr:hypothetical protein [Planctomycetia bacterium]
MASPKSFRASIGITAPSSPRNCTAVIGDPAFRFLQNGQLSASWPALPAWSSAGISTSTNDALPSRKGSMPRAPTLPATTIGRGVASSLWRASVGVAAPAGSSASTSRPRTAAGSISRPLEAAAERHRAMAAAKATMRRTDVMDGSR